MAEHDGNARGAGYNPLRRVAEYFETVGWNKRLIDLDRRRSSRIDLCCKEDRRAEDVYTEPYLAELFDRIVQNSVKPEPPHPLLKTQPQSLKS